MRLRLHEFAEKTFALDAPRKDGTTLRHHIKFLKENGVDFSEFDPPPLPKHLADIWSYFGEISLGRTSNGFGPNPLPCSEILAWSKLRRIRLGQFEFMCIRELDLLYLRSFNRG